jgi:hypothetical protein
MSLRFLLWYFISLLDIMKRLASILSSIRAHSLSLIISCQLSFFSNSVISSRSSIESSSSQGAFILIDKKRDSNQYYELFLPLVVGNIIFKPRIFFECREEIQLALFFLHDSADGVFPPTSSCVAVFDSRLDINDWSDV